MPIILSYLEAKLLHQPYFEGDFKICQNAKSGEEGCFSTDGERFIITREGLINAGKITKSFKFNKSEIAALQNSKFFTKILLNNDVAGLTSPAWRCDLFILLCIIFSLGFGLPILFFRSALQKRRLKVIIERPLLGSFVNTPHNYKEDFDEFIKSIKI